MPFLDMVGLQKYTHRILNLIKANTLTVSTSPNEDETGTDVTITDAKGEHSFSILNGTDATINGQNVLDLEAGENVNLIQDGSTLNISFHPPMSIVNAPVGSIIIWSGSTDDIPEGWQLCDGTNGTPDLRDKFVLGAGDNHPVGEKGGEKEHTLTIYEMPAHSHAFQSSTGVEQIGLDFPIIDSNVKSRSTTGVIGTVGGSQPHNNMPPYYALCYIMNVSAEGNVTTEQMEEAIAAAAYSAGTGIAIKGKVISTTTPTFEDYDTAAGWHVRKWSDGYIEMTYTASKVAVLTDWIENGNCFAIDNFFSNSAYPVNLTAHYTTLFSVTPEGHGYGAWVTQTSNSNALRYLPYFAIWRSTKPPSGDRTYVLNAQVTGRWKSTGTTYAASSIGASLMSPNIMVEETCSSAEYA